MFTQNIIFSSFNGQRALDAERICHVSKQRWFVRANAFQFSLSTFQIIYINYFVDLFVFHSQLQIRLRTNCEHTSHDAMFIHKTAFTSKTRRKSLLLYRVACAYALRLM